MTTAVANRDPMSVIEEVLITGNLASLGPKERIEYYNRLCDSVGLNPLTKPFEYLTLNGKLTLYARKDATDQLRRLHGISVTITSREMLVEAGLYVVTARATNADGRTDESIGAVTVFKLTGEALANALMKCETKAKRRVTLSIAGLGFLDETEVEDIPAKDKRPPIQQPVSKSAPPKLPAPVDVVTGEIVETPAWTMDELRTLAKGVGMALADLAEELGVERVTKSNIEGAVTAWLVAHPGADLAEFVEAARARFTDIAPALPFEPGPEEMTDSEPGWADQPGLH